MKLDDQREITDDVETEETGRIQTLKRLMEKRVLHYPGNKMFAINQQEDGSIWVVVSPRPMGALSDLESSSVSHSIHLGPSGNVLRDDLTYTRTKRPLLGGSNNEDLTSEGLEEFESCLRFLRDKILGVVEE